MPFVNYNANSPERTTHLLEQWHAANEEWKHIAFPATNDATAQTIAVVEQEEERLIMLLRDLQQKLLGR